MIGRETMGEFIVWIACCDKCGERFELETGSDDIEDAADEAREQGMTVERDKQKFEDALISYTEHYHVVTCEDCK